MATLKQEPSRLALLGHVLRRARRSLRENLFPGLVASGVVAVALVLLGAWLAASQGIDALLRDWQRDAQLSAYFRPEVPEARRLQARDELAARPEVQEVRYVTEAEARAFLEERVPEVRDVLDELGDVLPASLEITLVPSRRDAASIRAFADGLDPALFEEVDSTGDWVERFDAFAGLLRLVGAVLGLLIAGAGFFLVAATTHLAVYSRRDELEALRLVGATDTFVLGPFLVEALVHGLLGSAAALATLAGLHHLLLERLGRSLHLLQFQVPELLSPSNLALLVLLGAVLSLAGSAAAVLRFLRRIP